jgi:hypothetical protein
MATGTMAMPTMQIRIMETMGTMGTMGIMEIEVMGIITDPKPKSTGATIGRMPKHEAGRLSTNNRHAEPRKPAKEERHGTDPHNAILSKMIITMTLP